VAVGWVSDWPANRNHHRAGWLFPPSEVNIHQSDEEGGDVRKLRFQRLLTGTTEILQVVFPGTVRGMGTTILMACVLWAKRASLALLSRKYTHHSLRSGVNH